MKYKVCVLGVEGSLYTKILLKNLDERKIDYVAIIEKKISIKKNKFSTIISRPLLIFNLNKGRYKALPFLSIFKYKIFFESIIYKRSKEYKDLVFKYNTYKLNTANFFYVPNVNHARTLDFLLKNNFDMCLLGGVGIVDEVILKTITKFCLNAHPAPLPQCRGGGALENTLNYGLQPSVSVHLVTAQIDEGSILKVSEIELKKNDTFESITVKLSINCAEVLTTVVFDLLSNKKLINQNNEGKLHYWKDCTKEIQINARKKLKILLKTKFG